MNPEKLTIPTDMIAMPVDVSKIGIPYGPGDPAQPEGGAADPAAPAADSHEITVDGVKKTFSTVEVLKMAEKAGGADKRFAEASALRKQGELGLEVQNLVQVLRGGTATDDQIDRYCDIMEIPDSEREAYKGQGNTAVAGEEELAAEAAGTKNLTAAQAKAALNVKDRGDLDRLMRKEARLDAIELEDRQKKFQVELKKTLDKAESFKDTIKEIEDNEDNEESVSKITRYILGRSEKEVLARLQQGQRYSPKLLQDVVDNVIKDSQEFGKLFQRTNTPVLGLGSVGNQVQPLVQDFNKPVERVASDDPGYENNFAQRLAINLNKQLKKGK